MLSEDKINAFLSLQQIVLDIEDSTKLLDQFIPKVYQQLAQSGYSYEFLSAIFLDLDQKIRQSYLVGKNNLQTQVESISHILNMDNLLQKGSFWETQLLFGKPVIISDTAKLVNNSDNKLTIDSLLFFPIQNIHKLNGIFILGSNIKINKISEEDSEFIQMITRLIDLAYRLQDTQVSLTEITQQVYQMNAKLHQLDKLKDDFVSIASHELRTPMTAIRSYIWMALHRSDIPLSQKLERYLYRTLISTERLINLVNDMLNVSRIESGRIEINPQPFNMLALVNETVEEIRAKADERELKITILEDRLPQVFADPDKVHQILLNLIGNSLKFTEPGGVITISFFTDGLSVETSIKDNGFGISPQDLSKLFKKFGKLDNSYVSISTSGGTGLGLYISRSLVELMKGKIWAQSAGVDKGATFTFSLPVANADNLKHAEDFKIKAKGEVKELEPVAI